MKHVLICCSARSGGTWVGALFHCLPNVKFLWEPDLIEYHGMRSMRFWPIWNPDEVEKLVLRFKPHNDIPLPDITPSTKPDTCVAKIISPVGEIFDKVARPWCTWSPIEFAVWRGLLDAKVIHLVRHPVRWANSYRRIMRADDQFMEQALVSYGITNAAFKKEWDEEDWYTLVRHEDIVNQPAKKMRELFEWCGLKWHPNLTKFLGMCHSKDSLGPEQLHHVVMTPETVLNRWKAEETKGFVDVVNESVKEFWGGVYEPVEGVECLR